MFATAASSSRRNASATVGLRAKYQARAACASSAASGCSRTVWLATRSARQACLHHFPGNALYGAGIELLGAALDLSTPGLLDTFLNLDVEALNQRANQIGAILFRQRQCLAKNFVSRNRHGQSLLLRRTKRYVPSNGEVEGPDDHAGQTTRAHTVPRRPRRQTDHASRTPPTMVRRPIAPMSVLTYNCRGDSQGQTARLAARGDQDPAVFPRG